MKNFIKTIKGEDRDWEVVTIPIGEIKDTALFDAKYELSNLNKPRNPKMEIYIDLIKKKVLLPPLVLNENSNLRDGTHRLACYKYLGRKRIRVLRSLGKGTGKVKGSFPGMSTFPYKKITKHSGHRCLVCGELLTYKDGAGSPVGAFPQGMPNGKLHYCKDCGIVIKNDFVVWQK
jgi:hypothetical protein